MELTYDFPADVKVLVKISEIIAEAGRKAGFSDIEIGDIQLAVDEACTNTITHGLKSNPDEIFQLVIRWKPNQIDICIHETGEPFDPAKICVPDLNAPLEDRPIGGLGIYFVNKLMDEVEFIIGKDGVKTLRMGKRKS